MGYTVEATGAVVLPADREQAAYDAAREAMTAHQGWFSVDLVDDPESPVTDLSSLVDFAGAAMTRDGDRLLVSPAVDSDPKWSDQATAFWVALAPYADAGMVAFEGEDGETWMYRYLDGVLVQDGRNGFDGSTEPFGEAAETVGPVGTPMPALPPRPSGLSSNRVLRVAIGVAVLLLVLALL
ncbi:MAG: hypothetical protein CMH83_09325 [Nocardioides sp.]|nr:hypothetical protein [Nocardioides sp.]